LRKLAWVVTTTALAAVVMSAGDVFAEEAKAAAYDSVLARSLGADDMGMKRYVLVILKTGPTRVPEGPERDAMFRGHFENMKRLSDAGKLVLAGPLDGVSGWRGLYVFATANLEEAKALVATDPVIIEGEMVAECHTYYGSAALMTIPGTHERIAKKRH